MIQTQPGPASAAGLDRDPGGSSSGVLGSRPPMDQTFHGRDPDTVAASAICGTTPTRCQARTRQTNLTIQGNRMNVITKQVTSWAAIIAVPTFITGFYGMNVPYPGFSRQVGLATAIAIMIVSGLVLYIVFKRRDWLQAPTATPMRPRRRPQPIR